MYEEDSNMKKDNKNLKFLILFLFIEVSLENKIKKAFHQDTKKAMRHIILTTTLKLHYNFDTIISDEISDIFFILLTFYILIVSF